MAKNEFSTTEAIPYSDLFVMGEHQIFESDNNINLYPAVGDYYEFLTKDIHFIRILHFNEQEQHFTVKSDKPYIGLIVSFKNSILFIDPSKRKVFADIQHNQGGLIFINNQIFDNSWVTQPGAEICKINLTINYFKRFLPQTYP